MRTLRAVGFLGVVVVGDEGSVQVPKRSMPWSDAPPLWTRLKPRRLREDWTVYSYFVPLYTVSVLVDSVFRRKPSRLSYFALVAMDICGGGEIATPTEYLRFKHNVDVRRVSCRDLANIVVGGFNVVVWA